MKNKININENFNLIELYDILLESRGVIDGCDSIINTVKDYINNIIKNTSVLDGFYDGYDKENKVKRYFFKIPNKIFGGIETLFMKEPEINVKLFIMDNPYGDKKRELGENNYLSLYNPEIVEYNDKLYLNKPVFNIYFVLSKEEDVTYEEVGEKLGHELVHAKKNFEEYISHSKKREGAFKRDELVTKKLNNSEKDSLSNLIGRILYLCSNDEINARANQLYYQLKRYKNITRYNINNAVKLCDIYRFVDEFDDKIERVEKIFFEHNSEVTEYLKEELMYVYQVKEFKDMYKFLTNLLINRKNFFIRQINKVKERVLYEQTLVPIKK